MSATIDLIWDENRKASLETKTDTAKGRQATVFEDLEYVRTHDSLEGMPLQLPFWYPFSHGEHYKLVLGFQFYIVFYSNVCHSWLQALPVTLMTQITAEIKILQHNIRNFTRDYTTDEKLSKENAYLNLKKLIRDHQNIISWLQAMPVTIMTQITAEIKILQHNIWNFTRDYATDEKLSNEDAYLNLKKLIRDHQNIISWLQTMPVTMMTQITAEIKILQHNIWNFTRDYTTDEKLSKEDAYLNLKKLIRDHQNIISQTSKLNKALRVNIFIEYAIFSAMLASILLQVISSTNLGMAVYESNWYEQDKRTNQLLFILLMRTQKPLSVHIGPFGPLTIDAALSRFKLAYSYLSVMSS
ncbi:unnamed protein product [Ceutorhynchus assimilis]|uniref:Odorant receptor n=1 Tax=Ceutorhynchus assimilis TaxID=467358 RepID=A0A9N9MY74_9CUCU|nr:unnamed protein product [Ceutorhynchus assimilis]